MRHVFGCTDAGLVRPMNQDRYACASLSDDLAYAVLCDGMGGERGGHIASEIATTYAQQALTKGLEGAEGWSETSLRSILLSAVNGANALVYDAAQKDPNLAGMGTTMIVAIWWKRHMYIACVGDSRVYCVSPRQEQQITKDHTMVQMLVDIGEISEQDAKNHPKRHYITRAVGVSPGVDADFIVHPLEDDDIILLCSDGLYNYLSPDILYGMLHDCLEQGNAQKLIDFACANGGGDNITAVIMK